MCPMQTLHRRPVCSLGTKTQKRHCSGAFRSHEHDIIYGVSEALWTLGISPECLKAAVLCIESRYLFCNLILDKKNATRTQGVVGKGTLRSEVRFMCKSVGSTACSLLRVLCASRGLPVTLYYYVEW